VVVVLRVLFDRFCSMPGGGLNAVAVTVGW
jgi:hypothetical protein